MDKAAAHRSIARRSFLTKAAEAAAAGTSVLGRLKEVVGGATTRYSNLDPVVQKLLTAGIGAAAGAGVGSINLGHDRKGRHRGYLLGGEKGKSRTIGALAGAIAGLHVPGVHKAAEAKEAAYAEGFRKAAAASTTSVSDALGRAIVNKLPDEGRGALVYHGLMDPGNLVPLLGLVGGAHQITNAFDPDPEKSDTSRLVNGIAGLGLTAGGIYVGSNDNARNAVRKAVYKLFGKTFKAK